MLHMLEGGGGTGPADNDRTTSKPIWLEAWSDPLAGIKAYTPCVHTCNLDGDGEWRLIVGDMRKSLKVWKATQRVSELTLLGVPTAITSFLPDASSTRMPCLAVACGPCIYMYRSLRHFYKFTLPMDPVDPQEEGLWRKAYEGGMEPGSMDVALQALQDLGIQLTTRSMELLSLTDAQRRKQFMEANQNTPLVHHDQITCMNTIRKSVDELDAVSCLVAGTERGRVIILNPTATSIAVSVNIGGVPVDLAVAGLVDVEYRVVVSTREARICQIKNGALSRVVIQLETHAVGMVLLGKMIYVACMNEVLHGYTTKGEKKFSIYLPSPPLTIAPLITHAPKNSKCVIVALQNGEVRVYNERHLVSLHNLPSSITALYFGRYGREDHTLITALKSGALDIKILARTANLDVSSSHLGPPPEQEIPLQVPKKTKLYVEQAQRERDQAVNMHRTFQRDLCKLRLTTARTFVKLLTDGQGPTSYAASTQLSLHASVQGLGPHFKVQLMMKNEGSASLSDLHVLIRSCSPLYEVTTKHIGVPLLLSGLEYRYSIGVRCVDPSSGADALRISIISPKTTVPLLSALLKMPLSEPEDV